MGILRRQPAAGLPAVGEQARRGAGLAAPGSVAESLAGASRGSGEPDGRDVMIGRHALSWLRTLAVPLIVLFLASGIAGAFSGNQTGPAVLGTLFKIGMGTYATCSSAASLAAVAVCWRPARWVPQLRETASVSNLFPCLIATASVALYFLGAADPAQGPDGTAVGLESAAHQAAAGRADLLIGVLSLPVFLMSVAVYVLLYISYRLHPDARKTLYQNYKYDKRLVAEMRAQQAAGNQHAHDTTGDGGGRD